MLIDLLLVILLVLAVIKGFQRGLIVGVFSFVAILVGLAAAIKLSAVVAGYIGESVRISDQWLPVISFAVVFIAVVLLVRLGANLLQKTVEIGMLGWLNRLGGILLYVALFTIVYSVLLFYATELQLLSPAATERSVTYSYIQPWGPRVVGSFGTVLPFFRDMFDDLSKFFDGVAEKL